MIEAGNDIYLVTWAGTAVNGLLAILLTSAGLEAEVHYVGVSAVDVSPVELAALLSDIDARRLGTSPAL